MKYEKPELEIEKFNLVDEITGEGLSAGDIIIDESNNPGYEDYAREALGNIFNIK